MKKLLFTLLTLGLLIPTTYKASTKNSSSTEFFAKKQKKKKSSKKRKSKKTYSKSDGCTYNGYPLEVGPKGGCYYWSGNSKEYVDRSYCSGCN
jgi:Ni,Fe-hydrogenase I large subunit